MTKAATKTTTNGKAAGRNRIKDLPAQDAPSTSKIVIPRLDYSWVEIDLCGVTPLLVNKFREAAMDDIEAKQMGKATTKRDKREPEREFREACHICKGGYQPSKFAKSLHGFPATAFKEALAKAAYRFGGAKNIVDTISVVFIHGPYAGLVPLYQALPKTKRSKPKPVAPAKRRDAVVIGGKNPVTSLAYRPEYWPWATTLQIRYWDPIINLASVVNALHMAGQLVGVGSWRIENKGSHGMFTLGQIRELPKDFTPKAEHAK